MGVAGVDQQQRRLLQGSPFETGQDTGSSAAASTPFALPKQEGGLDEPAEEVHYADLLQARPACCTGCLAVCLSASCTLQLLLHSVSASCSCAAVVARTTWRWLSGHGAQAWCLCVHSMLLDLRTSASVAGLRSLAWILQAWKGPSGTLQAGDLWPQEQGGLDDEALLVNVQDLMRITSAELQLA